MSEALKRSLKIEMKKNSDLIAENRRLREQLRSNNSPTTGSTDIISFTPMVSDVDYGCNDYSSQDCNV